jgi:hypothetical protein
MKIRNEVIRKFSKSVVELFDFKKIFKGLVGTIVAFLAPRLFRVALEAVNEAYSDKIPEKHLKSLETLLEAFADKDWDKITYELIEEANKAIDVPYLDETSEGDIIGGILKGIIGTIKRKAS